MVWEGSKSQRWWCGKSPRVHFVTLGSPLTLVLQSRASTISQIYILATKGLSSILFLSSNCGTGVRVCHLTGDSLKPSVSPGL